jgi:tryptophan 2,3-dioxygenase
MEMALGQKRRSAVEHYPEGSDERRRLERRFAAPTLWDAFLRYLERAGHRVPHSALQRDVTQSVAPDPQLHDVLLYVYRHDAAAGGVCERLVDLDEGLQEWRYRHVKMVQRTIGTKPGTGGSSGAEYLTTTLNRPAFPDLWAIRTRL